MLTQEERDLLSSIACDNEAGGHLIHERSEAYWLMRYELFVLGHAMLPIQRYGEMCEYLHQCTDYEYYHSLPMEKQLLSSSKYEQYLQLKEKHQNALLLFRCGDFYEAYGDDARIVAEVLGIVLNSGQLPVPFTGFPHHALDEYLSKLMRNATKYGGQYGYDRIAILDPLLDPFISK